MYAGLVDIKKMCGSVSGQQCNQCILAGLRISMFGLRCASWIGGVREANGCAHVVGVLEMEWGRVLLDCVQGGNVLFGPCAGEMFDSVEGSLAKRMVC